MTRIEIVCFQDSTYGVRKTSSIFGFFPWYSFVDCTTNYWWSKKNTKYAKFDTYREACEKYNNLDKDGYIKFDIGTPCVS